MGWYQALRPNRLWLRELALVALVLAIYSTTNLPQGRHAMALEHTESMLALEDGLGMLWEAQIQDMVVGTWLVPMIVGVYAIIHPLLTIAFIAILFLSGSHVYPGTRNLFLVFSLLSFAVFFLYPAAPPRMLPEAGFIDLLHEEGPVSYETDLAKGIFNPYAAMPSVHFGYSLIVGGTLLLRFRRRLYFLGILYPGLMLFAVVASANHLIIDCLASVLLVVVSYYLVNRLDVLGRLTRFFKRSGEDRPSIDSGGP